MPLQENYQIVSFDITSMYSNIPNDLALKSVLEKWDLICNNTTISFHEFKITISIIQKSTFLKFNYEIYKYSIHGIFSLFNSSGFDDIQDLEYSIFKTLTIHVPLCYRYVDDIIIAASNEYINNEHINTILCSFNSS